MEEVTTTSAIGLAAVIMTGEHLLMQMEIFISEAEDILVEFFNALQQTHVNKSITSGAWIQELMIHSRR